jgi:hypothetical protein
VTHEKTIRIDQDIQNSILTTAQRKFLQSNVSGTSKARNTRARIRERVREGLRDFRILSDCLEARDRETIFGTDSYSANVDLQNDVKAAIAFMYAGVDGESGFRQPLIGGVQVGESRLQELDWKFGVEPRFAVDYVSHVDRREAVEAVENEQWDRLSHRSLFEFIRLAHSAGAIDFEKLHNAADYVESIPGERSDGSGAKE